MAGRHKKHEEHLNHEAWAIPYGDLITLLLAFFVVMYAISSVNEGKYRALSDSLAAAFAGAPRSMKPVEIGNQAVGRSDAPSPIRMQMRPVDNLPSIKQDSDSPATSEEESAHPGTAARPLPIDLGGGAIAELERVADEVEHAMQDLIAKDLVTVRRTQLWIEVEIKTDILFASGAAAVASTAQPILAKLAEVLAPFPNSIRVEGHTDNIPIRTVAFPSNWELSAARAASVVHLFGNLGIAAKRLAVLGLGEHRPVATNGTAEGRNRNRRVVLVVMADGVAPDRRVMNDTGVEETLDDAQEEAANAAQPYDALGESAEKQGEIAP